jgi:protein phosphatase
VREAAVVYRAAARTDVGRKRSGNEDSFCLAPELGLFLVADGMGGHAAGEVASRLAADAIRQAVARSLHGPEETWVGPPVPGLSREGNWLASSIQLANRAIFEAAASRADYEGMGTTLVAVLAHGDRLTLAHVGDSRIYRVRGGAIAQLTRDHSLVQEQVDDGILTRDEAQDSQLRHLITRALGIKATVDVDTAEEGAEPGDVLLLCSDGLSDLVEDAEMLAAVRDHPEPEAACQALVERANYRGGDDNITVLIIQVQPRARSALLTRLRQRLLV